MFHWDLLNEANENALKTKSKEEILRGGQSGAANGRETLMFWINQVLNIS